MPITSKTLNIMVISIFTKDGNAAVVGSIKRSDGTTAVGCIKRTGEYVWSVVDESLEDAKMIGMKNLLLICNDADLASIFMRPVCLPHDKMAKVPIGKKKTVKVPYGGCPHIWSIIRHTCLYKEWRCIHKPVVKQSEKLWRKTFD